MRLIRPGGYYHRPQEFRQQTGVGYHS
jgi:hypothetical protein